MQENYLGELFAGLKALAESAFPKHCNTCGRAFETAEQFLRETQQIRADRSGLKQSYDDNDDSILEVYRNCPCGSTLMDFFSDRRDRSEAGLQRRAKFAKVMDQIMARGVEQTAARNELLKFVRGEKSELIERLRKRTDS
jgi:hypothetical protein